MSGSFVWSVTFTCPCSGWTENRAIWRRSPPALLAPRRGSLDSLCPDFDNGTEYLNEQLIAFCREHTPPIPMSRSRAYRKNDKRPCGTKELDPRAITPWIRAVKDPRLVALLNDLYTNHWCPFHNFFQPSAKLVGKTRIGSRYRKRYDQPRTPCDRLLQSPSLSDQQKAALMRARDNLDPFLLKQQIEKKLNQIFVIVAADTGAGMPPLPCRLTP